MALATALAVAAGAMALVAPTSLAAASIARTAAARRIATGRAIDSKYFEPGSCVEFDPTSGDRHLTVFLDAGHGGIDPGIGDNYDLARHGVASWEITSALTPLPPLPTGEGVGG